MNNESNEEFISKIKAADGTFTIRDPYAIHENDTDSEFLEKLLESKELYKIVDELPSETDPDIDETKIYIVNKPLESTVDQYAEYIYVDNKWERLGYQDLTEYTKTDDLIKTISNEDSITNVIYDKNPVDMDTLDWENGNILIKIDGDYKLINIHNISDLITNSDYIYNDTDNVDRTKPINSKALDNYIKYEDYNIETDKKYENLSVGELVYTQEFNLNYEKTKELDIRVGNYIEDNDNNLIELTAENIFNYNSSYTGNTYTHRDLHSLLGNIVIQNDENQFKNYILQPMININSKGEHVLIVNVYCTKARSVLNDTGAIEGNLGTIRVTYI